MCFGGGVAFAEGALDERAELGGALFGDEAVEAFGVVGDVASHHFVAVFLIVASSGEFLVFEDELVFGCAADEDASLVAEDAASLRLDDDAVGVEAVGDGLPAASAEGHEADGAQDDQHGKQHHNHDDRGVAFGHCVGVGFHSAA